MSNSIETRAQIEKKMKMREIWLKTLSVIAILILVAGLGVFIYFQTTDDTRLQLSDPTSVRVEQTDARFILTFDAVENASAYRYTINGNAQQVGASATRIDITELVSQPQKYEITVQALGDDGYKNSNIVSCEDLEVYVTLDVPIVSIDKYDSKLVWVAVEGAESYEVTVITDNDFSTMQTYRVTGVEFDISEIVVDYQKDYSFSVKALSTQQYINQSPSSVAVNQKLLGRLEAPKGLTYSDADSTLYWEPVENAETYTVVLVNTKGVSKEYLTDKNNYTFSEEDLSTVGSYKTYVYANNVQSSDAYGETIWFLASKNSEDMEIIVYEQLETPSGITCQLNNKLVWIQWEEVPNAIEYIFELVNADGEKYYESKTTTKEINIERDIVDQSANGLMWFRIKANGYGYYLTSEYSTITEVDISDKFGAIQNIEVLEDGKYLTFTPCGTNESGTMNVMAGNGYNVVIKYQDGNKVDADGNPVYIVVYDDTIKSTVLDTSAIFTQAQKYVIEVKVNKYGYFKESDVVSIDYYHQIQLEKPYDIAFEKTDEGLIVKFKVSTIPQDLTLDIGTNVIENLVSSEYGVYVIYTEIVENSEYEYQINYSKIYEAINGFEPTQVGQRYSAKVKALGDTSLSTPNQAGYRDSVYSDVAIYENKIKLATPEFVKVENFGDENVLLYFSQVENASNYLVQIWSETTQSTYMLTTRLTTVNIYDIISAGNNIIKIRALGTGFYLDSDDSEGEEYFYTAILKAPTDVTVVEEEIDGSTHFYVQFTTTRFAKYYEIQIKQTQRVVDGADGERTVENIPDAEFELLGTKYLTMEGVTKCDITDYLRGKEFGRFEVQVRGVLEQKEVVEQPIIYSDWSNTAYYNYYDQQLAPTNLVFDENTNILTFTGVATARNGYAVKVEYKLEDGTYASHEVITGETTVDLSQEILARGGVGEFRISAMTLRVDELYLRNSDWSTAVVVEIRYTLSAPTNFFYNEVTGNVSWTSDSKMDYETLRIEFSNSNVSNLLILSITDKTFNSSIYGLLNLINQYGDGFYKITVQSHSNNMYINSSIESEFIYTKYLQLNAPELIEVVDRNGKVEATFTTVENGKTYAIVAKLETQNEWSYILEGIQGEDGQATITVDIKQSLINFLGANKYEIAVVAESYDYFAESEKSNTKSYELWLTFSAPSGLTVVQENGVHYAVWNAVPYAKDYTLTVDGKIVKSDVNTNRYDLTEVLGQSEIGHFVIGVKTNATGYYYESLFTTYDFYLMNVLETPQLEYNEETYELKIIGQGDGKGYQIEINYFESDTALGTGVATKTTTVEQFVGTTLSLKNHFSVTGLGIYKIKVKELGDETYWNDSEWSEELTAYYTVPFEKLLMFSVDKRENGAGGFDYYAIISKTDESIYQNAVVKDNVIIKYEIYEVESLDAELSEDATPILTFYSTQNEVKIDGLTEAKYYIAKATILGGFENAEIYLNGEYLDASTASQVLKEIAYYTNSQPSTAKFSTMGNLLGSPVITKVEMDADKYLEITFNKSVNANDYTLMVNRDSKNVEIYNAVIDENNADAVIGENEITVRIPAVVSGFTDEYDIYNIVLFANEVLVDGEIAYGQSPNTEFSYEYITQLQAPTVEISMQAGGDLRVSVVQIEFATGYVIEVSINGFAQEYQVGAEGYILFGNPQYGTYIARAKAIGDNYHKDSEYGDYANYNNTKQLGEVEEVRIVSNGDANNTATRIYAEWDAVDGATYYGIKIEKDGVAIFEDETNRTYYDLLNIFSANGYATYTVWVKTNSDGTGIVGESTYKAYANYVYKGQFAIPSNLNIDMQEFATYLKYTISFESIEGAEEYTISFYSSDGTYQLQFKLTLKSGDLVISNGKASADISEFLNGKEGGEYLVTIKVEESRENLGSGESEPVEFTNYHKHADPQIQLSQVGQTPQLRLAFNDVDNAIGYQLLINGEIYLVDYQEIFSYPTNGYLNIYAKYLNIGQNNQFTLIILGDRNEYYLDTTYTKDSGVFTFRLSQVTNIFIEHTNETIIPNGDTSQVILTFTSVDFATGYELWIDNEYVTTLRGEETIFDISSIFAGKMPRIYRLSVIAIDEVYGLSSSNESVYQYNYTLRFTAPSDLALTNLQLTWSIPSNLEDFSRLAETNGATLGEQQYEIFIYYTSSAEEKIVLQNGAESFITTLRNYDLSTFLSEPGGYRIDVYACDNSGFSASLKPASLEFHITTQLDTVTGLRVYQDGTQVKIDFEKVEKKDYIYADQNMYYDIYINGVKAFSVSGDASTYGVIITEYLWGGDNVIQVYTRDVDSSHFFTSNPAQVEYTHTSQFVAIHNAVVYNDQINNKQYIRFDSFEVNGLSQDEILSLTYTVSAYNALTNELILSKNTLLATVFSFSTYQIDVTEFIKGIAGSYQFVVKINEYRTTKTTSTGVIEFVMNESAEVSINYEHKLTAEMLDLSLLVIDVDGNVRDPKGGLEMSEMWLSYDVKFSQEYLSSVNELLYTILINQKEYFLTIPFSYDYIGQTVDAQGALYSDGQTTPFTTQVKYSSYMDKGQEVVTMSVSVIPLITTGSTGSTGSFNIYMSGTINIKARSEEQGFYYASSYQPNFLVYVYTLKYKTPTGLELVVRDDGLHYIKWDLPTHPFVEDYYKYIEEYNVKIYSEGVPVGNNQIIDPHSTKGGEHSIDFKTEDVLVEGDYLYYLVEDYLFAGLNRISLKCNASEKMNYLESDTITIAGQEFVKKLATPEFEIKDLDANKTGNDNAQKGVEIVITNYDRQNDYDSELRKIVNYNTEALYRLTVTSGSRGFSDVLNAVEPTYMTYNIDFKVSRTGNFEVLSGDEYLLSSSRIYYTTTNDKGQLHIVWLLKEPGEYTYTVQAIGREEYYTSNSEISSITHQTTYNAPDLSLSVTVYHNVNGVDVVRSANETTKISKIVMQWQTKLSSFYGTSYTITIQGLFNGEQTNDACLNGILVTNATSITFSPTENSEIFEVISKRPANYRFIIYSNQVNAECYEGADSQMLYYQAYNENGRLPVEKNPPYVYTLQINTPQNMEIVEVGTKAYIKVDIPQYFIDAGIQNQISQITAKYTIYQLDPSFNLGSNTSAKSYTNSRAEVLLGNSVEGGLDGYYYIDITGQLYPGINRIVMSFNSISEQYFAASEQAEIEYNYVITLDEITGTTITNLYSLGNNNNYYVSGFVISFNNVEFNKYFAYLLEIKGTQYNASFSKTLLLKVDPNYYVAGSKNNYSYVKCYDLTSGIAQVVVVNNMYTRSMSGNNYVYSKYTYKPAQSSTSYNNVMSIAVLIDGGIPDNYSYTITTLGELNSDRTENTLISDITTGESTISSKSDEFTYIMKGTLKQADLQVGVYENGVFYESTNNESENHLAFIYDNDGNDESYVYLTYNPNRAPSGSQYEDKISLKLTIPDSQAKYYALQILNPNNQSINFSTYSKYSGLGYDNIILVYENGKYVSALDGVEIVNGNIVYIDLMKINGGVFTLSGKYRISVRAINDNKVINEVNAEESLYENEIVESLVRYVARYDRVVTPQLSYTANSDSENRALGIFTVKNYSQINNIIKKNSYSLVIQYATTPTGFSTSQQIVVESASFNTQVGVNNGSFIIKESYIKEILDARIVALGTLYIRIMFDVPETAYIWDSLYSKEEVKFDYKAYIEMPVFASSEDEYEDGVGFGLASSVTIYTDNSYNTNQRELATGITIMYDLTPTEYIRRQGWQVEFKVRLSTSSKEVTWILPFGTKAVDILDYFRGSNTEMLGELFEVSGKTMTYGDYDIYLRINRILDKSGNEIASNKVAFDTSSYRKSVRIKAKFYEPANVDLSYNENSRTIYRVGVSLTSGSYLSKYANGSSARVGVEIYRNGRYYSGTTLYPRNSTKVTGTLNITDSGEYYAVAYVYLSSSHSDAKYFESSYETEMYGTILIPYVVGIYGGELEVDSSNNVTLEIYVRQAKNLEADGHSDFEGTNLDSSQFRYNVELYSYRDLTTPVWSTTNKTLSSINSDLTTQFKAIMSNLGNGELTGFAPGAYFLKISTVQSTCNGINYEPSSDYYVADKISNGNSNCNSYLATASNKNKTALKNASYGFQCKYSVGYEVWAPSYISYLRGDTNNKGYVSGVSLASSQVLREKTGNLLSPVLKFVKYSFESRQYVGRTGGSAEIKAAYHKTSSISPTTVLGIAFVSSSLKIYTPQTNYASNSSTETNEGQGIIMYVEIDYNSSLLKNCKDYIILNYTASSTKSGKVLTYSGVKESGGRAQYEPKRQRLPSPSNIKISYEWIDNLIWDDRKWTVTWDFSNSYSDYLDRFEVKGSQKYNYDTAWNWTAPGLDSVGPGDFGYIIGSYVYRVNRTYSGKDKTFSFTQCQTAGMWDDQYVYNLIGFLFGGEKMLKLQGDADWMFDIKAFSNSAEYDNSVWAKKSNH